MSMEYVTYKSRIIVTVKIQHVHFEVNITPMSSTTLLLYDFMSGPKAKIV